MTYEYTGNNTIGNRFRKNLCCDFLDRLAFPSTLADIGNGPGTFGIAPVPAGMDYPFGAGLVHTHTGYGAGAHGRFKRQTLWDSYEELPMTAVTVWDVSVTTSGTGVVQSRTGRILADNGEGVMFTLMANGAAAGSYTVRVTREAGTPPPLIAESTTEYTLGTVRKFRITVTFPENPLADDGSEIGRVTVESRPIDGGAWVTDIDNAPFELDSDYDELPGWRHLDYGSVLAGSQTQTTTAFIGYISAVDEGADIYDEFESVDPFFNCYVPAMSSETGEFGVVCCIYPGQFADQDKVRIRYSSNANMAGAVTTDPVPIAGAADSYATRFECGPMPPGPVYWEVEVLDDDDELIATSADYAPRSFRMEPRENDSAKPVYIYTGCRGTQAPVNNRTNGKRLVERIIASGAHRLKHLDDYSYSNNLGLRAVMDRNPAADRNAFDHIYTEIALDGYEAQMNRLVVREPQRGDQDIFDNHHRANIVSTDPYPLADGKTFAEVYQASCQSYDARFVFFDIDGWAVPDRATANTTGEVKIRACGNILFVRTDMNRTRQPTDEADTATRVMFGTAQRAILEAAAATADQYDGVVLELATSIALHDSRPEALDSGNYNGDRDWFLNLWHQSGARWVKPIAGDLHCGAARVWGYRPGGEEQPPGMWGPFFSLDLVAGQQQVRHGASDTLFSTGGVVRESVVFAVDAEHALSGAFSFNPGAVYQFSRNGSTVSMEGGIGDQGADWESVAVETYSATEAIAAPAAGGGRSRARAGRRPLGGVR